MTPELRLVIIGGVIGIVGALLGAGVGAIIEYWLGEIRDKHSKRQQNLTTALEWATTGRKKNLRHIDLQGMDLRGVDFSSGPDQERGADLSYSNLRDANLSNAQMINSDLRGADMRGAILTNTNFTGAYLIETKLGTTNLCEAIIDDANMFGANLLKANITVEKLKRAETFDKAILPNGERYYENGDEDNDDIEL
jgi:serine/threonine protein kinase, bacterial